MLTSRNKFKMISGNGKAKQRQKRDYKGYIQKKFSPKTFSEAIEGLSEVQIKWIKKTGFGGLLRFRMATYPHRLGYNIAQSYDSQTSTLQLEAGNIKISELVVKKVLGLPNGTTKIELMENDCVVSKWAEQFHPTPKCKVTPSMVYQKMNRYEGIDEMFKLNFLVLMANFFIESNQNGAVNRDILNFRGNLDACYDYNWCEIVIDKLNATHNYWALEPTTRFFTGSLPFLIVS